MISPRPGNSSVHETDYAGLTAHLLHIFAKILILIDLNVHDIKYENSTVKQVHPTLGLEFDCAQVYDWVEFFAGLANGTRAARLRGAAGVKLDLLYFDEKNPANADFQTNYMDITSPSGFW